MRTLLALALLVTPVAMAQQTLTFVDSENPGAGPCGITTTMGRNTFLLTGSHFEDRITSYRVLNNGALEPGGTANVAPGSMPAAIGFGWGRFAVVANKASSDLYVFRMNRSGQFTQVGQPVSTQGVNPVDMVVSRAGLVAVANNMSDELSTFWLDPRGGLHFLDKINTGLAPTGVAVSGTRIAVANSGSADVSVFRLNRLRNLQLESTTSINANPVDLAFGAGNNLYVSSSPAQQGAQSKLFHLRLNRRNGSLTQVSDVDAGLFLSGLTADNQSVYGATVNASGQNEIRVYDRRLNQTASATLASPPNTMTLAVARAGRRSTDVFLNEFNNNTTSSFRLER